MKGKTTKIVVGVALFFVFGELLSLGWYAIEHSELFYFSDKQQLSIVGGQDSKELITDTKLHPYKDHLQFLNGRPKSLKECSFKS